MDRTLSGFTSLSFLAVAMITGVALIALPYRIAGVLLIGVVITAAAVLVTRRLAPVEDRDFLPALLVWALLAKMVATLVRLYMNEVVYGGGDSNKISNGGALVATDIRSFEFESFTSRLTPGTEFSEALAGLVYSVFGNSYFGEFFLYAFFAFLGSVLFYRAFRMALPDGSRGLLAALIFFYPALLYWPTGVGKDSVVYFFLGVSVWGGMCLAVRSRPSGIVWAVAGLIGIFFVRPEIGLIASAALFAGVAARISVNTRYSVSLRFMAVALVAAATLALMAPGLAVVGVNDFSVGAALDVVDNQAVRVFDEGRQSSNFVTPEVMTLGWIPSAFVTVLFRPFPWEAHNLQALVQSLEGALMAGILLLMFPQAVRGLRQHWTNPLIVYSLVFVLLGVIALATLGNFGLLARQRAVILPFVFFILAAAPRTSQVCESSATNGSPDTQPA